MTRDRQKARNASMVKSLCIEVVSTLDDYQSWANSASDAGRVTSVQFLAVVLWAVSTSQGRDLSESEVNGVISKWWERLVEATVKRAATLGGHGPYRRLYPFDVLTLLEVDQNKVSAPQGWCMRIEDADDWLCSNGAGAWCAAFFDSCGLRGRVVDSDAPAIAVEWTGEKLAAQLAIFKVAGHRDFAKRTWELAGVGERDGRRLVEASKAALTSAAGMVTSVFDMGKKTTKKASKRA